MIKIRAKNILEANKEAFRLIAKNKESTTPDLWREEPASVFISLSEKEGYFKITKDKFEYYFDYKKYFPYVNKSLIEKEERHWEDVILKEDKLVKLVDYMKKNRLTKRAIIDLWEKPFRDPQLTVPCLVYLFFRRGDGFLHLHSHFRANNLLFLFVMDMQAMKSIQEYVADKLGLKIGRYVHFIDSLHFYKREMPKIKKQYSYIKESDNWKL